MIAGLVAWAAGTRTAHTALKGWNPKGVISFDPYDIIRLGRCNAMGRSAFEDTSPWMPYRMEGGEFFTFSGLKATPPPIVRGHLSAEEIIAELKSRREVPYSHQGNGIHLIGLES